MKKFKIFFIFKILLYNVVGDIMNNYIIISNSTRLSDKKIKELVDLRNETIYFDMNFNKTEEVLEEASYTSLFNDKKNLIVTNAEVLINGNLKDANQELLLSYLNNPNDITTMVFLSKEKPTKKSDFVNLIKKQNNFFDLIKEKVDLNSLIINHCKENKFSINKDALNCLKNSLSNNCDLILNELDKLFLYYGKPSEITLEIVQKNCSNIVDENNFKFVDLVVAKKVEESLKYLKELLIMKVEPLSLFSLLVREFRLLLLYKIIDKSDHNFSELISVYNLKDWQLDKIGRNAYSYKLKELKRIMKVLADYDLKFKSGKVEKSLFLELLLLEIYEF